MLIKNKKELNSVRLDRKLRITDSPTIASNYWVTVSWCLLNSHWVILKEYVSSRRKFRLKWLIFIKKIFELFSFFVSFTYRHLFYTIAGCSKCWTLPLNLYFGEAKALKNFAVLFSLNLLAHFFSMHTDFSCW